MHLNINVVDIYTMKFIYVLILASAVGFWPTSDDDKAPKTNTHGGSRVIQVNTPRSI